MPTGPPSSPVNLTSSVQQYARSNVSIILQWNPNPPVDSRGTSVDNYTITVTGPTMQELISLGPTANIIVVYNEMYTVNVRASNCVGSSTSATANIFQGKDHVFGIKGWYAGYAYIYCIFTWSWIMNLGSPFIFDHMFVEWTVHVWVWYHNTVESGCHITGIFLVCTNLANLYKNMPIPGA